MLTFVSPQKRLQKYEYHETTIKSKASIFHRYITGDNLNADQKLCSHP